MHMWRTRCSLAWMLVWVLAVPAASKAEEGEPQSKPRVELSVRSWMFTNGQTTWSHNASGSDPRLGNPTSKLTYKDDNTQIVELGAKLNLSNRWFLRGDLGFSVALDRGSLIDEDYLAGQHLYLQTRSNLSGSGTWYVNGDLGYRAIEFRNGRGHLDVFGGVQYWRTKYEATGLDVQSCDAGVITCPAPRSGGLVITNTSQWITPLRFGIDTEYRLTRWLDLEGKLAVSPLSLVYNEDRHELRGDLQKPSFTMWGAGGSVNADAGVKVMLTKSLALTGGYRVWWNAIYTGTMETHPVGSGSESFPLREFQTLRHGPTIGLTGSF